MDTRSADLHVYPALGLATSLYALLLDDNKRRAPDDQKLEPDWTWLEVVIGTMMCLVAAAIRSRLGDDDRRTTERSVWLAFLVGGAPIILWQNWRAYARQKRRGDTLQQYVNRGHEHDASTRPAPPLARLRQRGPSTNGGLS